MGDDLPFGSRGGVLIRYHFPLDGEYTIKVLLRAPGVRLHHRHGRAAPARRSPRRRAAPALLRWRRSQGHDDARRISPATRRAIRSSKSTCITADAALEVRVPVKAGLHDVGVSFVRRFWEPEGFVQPPPTGFWQVPRTRYYHGNPAVEFVMIGGPYGAAAPGDSVSRRKMFVCQPQGQRATEEPCARRFSCRWLPAPIGGRSPNATSGSCMDFYKTGQSGGEFRCRQSGAASSGFSPHQASCSGSNANPSTDARWLDVSPQRSRAGFAALVLPVEQHPRRRAARRLAVRGKLNDPAVLEQQVRANAARSTIEGAHRQFRQPLARVEQACRCRSRHRAVFRVRREPS